MRQPTLLVISQVYVPDPASVGQHLHDAAVEVTKRGYRTRVFTAARGYDEPDVRFPRRECIDGVEVIRLPFSSFGKRSLFIRMTAQISFLVQVALRGLFTPKLGAILVSTIPSMCSAVGLLIAAFRRVPVVYWVMDINPDQAIAMGAIGKNSPLVWLLNLLNRAVLHRAKTVVTLDRLMAARLMRKHEISEKLVVLPPWPHESHLDIVGHEDNPFRREHKLDGKFVVMYSGNHSLAHPIATLLEAAERLQNREDVVFVFVGGGMRKKEVADAVAGGATNIIDLPYQPMSELKYSLSAADLHVITVGDAVVGIVHPCKVYGAMAVARPVLLIGPQPCHVSDMLQRHDIGRHVKHGDVDGAVRAINELADLSPAERVRMGNRARRIVQEEFSMSVLCTRFGDILEAALQRETNLDVFAIEEQRADIAYDPVVTGRSDKKKAA